MLSNRWSSIQTFFPESSFSPLSNSFTARSAAVDTRRISVAVRAVVVSRIVPRQPVLRSSPKEKSTANDAVRRSRKAIALDILHFPSFEGAEFLSAFRREHKALPHAPW